MSTAAVIEAERCDEILQMSIDRQMRATVTHRSHAGWRSYKATVQSGTKPANTYNLRVYPPAHQLGDPLPDPGSTLGVTFRLGHKKCMLSSRLRCTARQGESIIFTLDWPVQLRQLKRRSFERAAPPAGQSVAVRFWPARAPGVVGRIVHHGQLEDLSAGGMRIRTADLSNVELDSDYECIFTPRHGSPPIVIEATLRHREAADHGRAALGFKFVGLETTAEGRRTLDRLARIVSRFQRANGKARHKQPRSD